MRSSRASSRPCATPATCIPPGLRRRL
jgi:hypothetical protein